MAQYQLFMRTMAGAMPWHHVFDVASDNMAIEWAERNLALPYNVPLSCMGADLFSTLPEKHVASFVVRSVNCVTKQ